MNTESVATRKRTFGEQEMERPGDFCFAEDFGYIYVWLPGRKAPDAITVHRGSSDGVRVWGWDGNEESPTLTPSIHDLGNWHGHLVNGVLKSC